MAVQNYQLLIWDGTKQKRIDSETTELKLGKLSLAVLGDVEAAFAQEAIDRAAGDASTLASAKAYADAGIAAASGGLSGDISDLQADLAQEILDRQSGDTSTLNSAKAYADQKITDLVGAAPATLDTLKEIADAINNDASIAATLTSQIGAVQSNLTTEISNRQSGDNALDARLDVLETDPTTKTYVDNQLATLSFGIGQTKFVAKDGNDVSGDGTLRKPFASITAALAAITDASPSKRYVVKVGPGAYSEAGIALKANVFVVGDMQDAVRITAPVTMASDFSGSADNRSGFSNVTLLSAVNFDWSTVTSAAGKLYLNEVVFASTLRLYGHNNAIAQAQIQSCEIFGTMTVSGINVGIHSNNIHYGEIKLDQHPNGGMATILAASGGKAAKITLTTTVNDFNRRCSLFAYAGFFIDELIVSGASSYADLSESSVPRDPAKLTSPNSGNVVYLTTTVPHKTNERNVGQPGRQYLYNFAYVHASTQSDLYVISMGGDYAADSAGRGINIEADSYGLLQNVNGGDINLVTAATSGTGVRGKIKLSGRQIDVDSAKIVNVANGVDAADAVNKSQLDAEASARASADTTLAGSISTVSSGLAQEILERAAAVSGEASARVAGDAATLASAQSYADGKVSALVNSAPAVLDTLKELADALGSDPNFATTVAGQIGTVSAAVTAEVTRATGAESALQGEVDAVESGLAQELLDRAAADTALQGSISTVSSELAQELLDRAAADTALQGAVDDVAADLAQELLDRAAADTALQGAIDDVAADLAQELLDRASAVSAVQGEVDALELVVADLKLISLTASEAISAGQVCYIKSNGEVAKAIATVDLSDAQLVVASASVASGAAGKFYVVEGSVIGGFSSLTPGKKYFVSAATAGAVVSSTAGFATGNSVYTVGRAVSATQISFAPVFEFEY